MSKKLFTQEEQTLLRENPYVESVTDKSIVFTPEFKALAYDALMRGEHMRRVFESCSINPNLLGVARVNAFREKLQNYAEREEGFRNLRKRGHAGAGRHTNAMNLTGRIVTLEQTIDRLEREIASLKALRCAAQAD